MADWSVKKIRKLERKVQRKDAEIQDLKTKLEEYQAFKNLLISALPKDLVTKEKKKKKEKDKEKEISNNDSQDETGQDIIQQEGEAANDETGLESMMQEVDIKEEEDTHPSGAAIDSMSKEPKKKTKKPKDPNEPKKPLGSFFLFFNEVREQLKTDHPGATNPQLASLASSMWKEESDSTKEAYKEAYKLDKLRYEKEMETYTETRTGEPLQAEVAKEIKQTPKKKKAARDPDQPKKGQTSFFIYLKLQREEFKAANPNLSNTEISKQLARRWNELTAEEKEPYIKKQKKQAKSYQKKMVRYLKQKALAASGTHSLTDSTANKTSLDDTGASQDDTGATE